MTHTGFHQSDLRSASEDLVSTSGSVLHIPEWTPLRLRLRRSDLRRHVLVIGETGSGKTTSVLIPILEAVLCSRSEASRQKRPSALVIDPKDGELSAFLGQHMNGDRLRVIRPESGDWLVPFFIRSPSRPFSDPQHLIDQLMRSSRGTEAGGTRSAGFWIASVRRLLGGLIAADHWIAENEGPEEVLAGWKCLLGNGTRGTTGGTRQQPSTASEADVAELWRRGGYLDILAWALTRSLWDGDFLLTWGGLQSRRGCPPTLWDATSRLGRIAHETLSGIVLTAQNLLDPLTLPATNGHLWTNPYSRPDSTTFIDATALMDQGYTVTYQPVEPSMRSNILGRAIKQNFFHAALRTRDRSREFLYLADEFQRFITADPESSEAAFFDRARSFGVSCVVATQSESSLRLALQSGPDAAHSDSALQVMLSNLATQFYFRSTDPRTQDRLRNLIPRHPSDPKLPHVMDVRPVTSLRTGEVYWLSAAGRWGRGRVRLKTRSVVRETNE